MRIGGCRLSEVVIAVRIGGCRLSEVVIDVSSRLMISQIIYQMQYENTK